MKSPSPRLVGLLALGCAFAYGLWLWVGPPARGELSDGVHTIARDESLRLASWGEPEPAFAATPWSSAPARLCLSPDGRWLVWSSSAAGGNADLFVAPVQEGRVERAALLSAACSEADESAPAFGGEWLYFSSDRPGGSGGHDLWRARFAEGQAQAPELVPGMANTASDEFDPAPNTQEDTLVFAAERDGAGLDLYRVALGGDGAAVRLDALCSPGAERDPVFTPDGRALLFASDRDGGTGGFDLYRAAHFAGTFGALQALLPLNSAADERAPLVPEKSLALLFSRAEAGSASYQRSPALELFLTPRRAIHWTEWLALALLLALAALGLLLKRFPELGLLYKCLLVSVLAHLLLLWWFHELWLSGPASEPRPSRAPMQVRLADRVARPVAAVEPPRLPQPEPEVRSLPSAPLRAQVAASSEARPPQSTSVARRAEDASRAAAFESAEQLNPARTTPRNLEVSAATPTSPAAALPLPALAAAGSSAAESSPQRLQARAPAGSAVSSSSTIAHAAPDVGTAPERAATAASPQVRSPRVIDSGEPAVAARPAEAATALALLAEDAGAPSSSSRSIGTPSRAQQQRPQGAPAASLSSKAVASAASARESAPGRLASAASPASSAPGAATQDSRARAALAEGEAAVATTAGASAALELSDAASGGGGESAASPLRSGPNRASALAGTSGRAVSAPSQGSVAQRSGEIQTGSTGAPQRAVAALAAPSGSAASQAAGAQEALEVAEQAAQGPGLGLDSLRPESEPGVASGAASNAGPQRAVATGMTAAAASPGARSAQPLAERGAAPQAGVARAPSALHPGGAQRGERTLTLQDAPESVAQAAAPGAAEAGGDWLGDLSSTLPASPRSSNDSAAAPARATNEASAPSAAQPLATNVPALERGAAPDLEQRPTRGASDWEATPYQNRSGAEKARAIDLYGGSERTEAAVAKGLEYLASIQGSGGAWGDLDAVDPKYGRVAVGKTALCTLAFLGAGHTQTSRTQHSAVVARAVEFLLSMQEPESGHFGDSSAYDHGIATYALAECFALTKDARLRAPLELAIAHVLDMQSTRKDPRFEGGWGYYRADGSLYDPWPRTSITAWQVMALESARLSGLAVPDAAFEAVRAFLTNCEDERLGAYRYNHDPERLQSQYPTLPASTPAALFALALLGEDITTPVHAVAREYVIERAPDGYRYTGEADFVALARGNPYYWYYGTLAMFRVGGSSWQRWNVALQETLLPAQARDGSWKPIDVYARYARDSAEDKSYTTALCVLSLEVYYRYYLPLLKVR